MSPVHRIAATFSPRDGRAPYVIFMCHDRCSAHAQCLTLDTALRKAGHDVALADTEGHHGWQERHYDAS
jgi:hypothetical protein